MMKSKETNTFTQWQWPEAQEKDECATPEHHHTLSQMRERKMKAQHHNTTTQTLTNEQARCCLLPDT
jgi:hypothetical protein